MKDLYLLKKCIKNQEASSYLRLGYTLSNRPHLHRVYYVNVCRVLSTAVCVMEQIFECHKNRTIQDIFYKIQKFQTKIHFGTYAAQKKNVGFDYAGYCLS